jgi:hypothetical protein
MKSESGFLNTRHDIESGDTSAASPAGRKKSTKDWPPRSNSARVAASKPLRSGQGKTIGLVTATSPNAEVRRDRLNVADQSSCAILTAKVQRAMVRVAASVTAR